MRHRVEAVLKTESGYLVERLESPKYPDNIGKLRCPGGAVEHGETPLAALCREMYEEYSVPVLSRDVKFVSKSIGQYGPITRYEVCNHGLVPRYSNSGDEVLIEVGALPPIDRSN